MIALPLSVPIANPVDGENLEAKRRAALEWLGVRWILHPVHAPKKRKARK